MEIAWNQDSVSRPKNPGESDDPLVLGINMILLSGLGTRSEINTEFCARPETKIDCLWPDILLPDGCIIAPRPKSTLHQTRRCNVGILTRMYSLHSTSRTRTLLILSGDSVGFLPARLTHLPAKSVRLLHETRTGSGFHEDR
jgi:hypothetical protein